MATLDVDDTEQPMDPKLVLAIESAFRSVSLTSVQFAATPRIWQKSNPAGSSKGPKPARKANIKMELAKRDGARCAYCAREFVDLDDATLDHVIPNTVVGHWQPWNLLLACGPCNNQKADRVPVVLMPLLCALLQELMPVARKARRAQQSKADRLAWHKKRLKADREARERRALVIKQIETLSPFPVRLAIEASTPRTALLPGTGGA